MNILEIRASSKAQKINAALRMERVIRQHAITFYGSDGYSEVAATHELEHSLADNGQGLFQITKVEGKKNDIFPSYTPLGERSPRQTMKIASAVGEMSRKDRLIYSEAKKELKKQVLKTLFFTFLVTSPFICGGLMYFASQ